MQHRRPHVQPDRSQILVRVEAHRGESGRWVVWGGEHPRVGEQASGERPACAGGRHQGKTESHLADGTVGGLRMTLQNRCHPLQGSLRIGA